MSTSTDTQTTIEFTLTKADKEILEKAAAAKCLTLNDYLLEVALSAAKETPEIEEIVLSDGFIPLEDDELSLFIPIATIIKVIE